MLLCQRSRNAMGEAMGRPSRRPTKWEGKISLDSISENSRQRTTTTAMDSKNGATAPPTNIIGAKAAMVVNTPIVEGIATL